MRKLNNNESITGGTGSLGISSGTIVELKKNCQWEWVWMVGTVNWHGVYPRHRGHTVRPACIPNNAKTKVAPDTD